MVTNVYKSNWTIRLRATNCRVPRGGEKDAIHRPKSGKGHKKWNNPRHVSIQLLGERLHIENNKDHFFIEENFAPNGEHLNVKVSSHCTVHYIHKLWHNGWCNGVLEIVKLLPVGASMDFFIGDKKSMAHLTKYNQWAESWGYNSVNIYPMCSNPINLNLLQI